MTIQESSLLFITLWGLYEWNRIPFDLRNTPALSLEGLRDKICIPYFDDELVYSQTFAQNMEDVRQVMRRQREYGNKLQPNKCELFKNEVCYIAKVISAEGYGMDEKEIAAVQALKSKSPSNIREVRKLLCFLGYYRSYMHDFSRHAKCLYNLLTEKLDSSSAGKRTSKRRAKGLGQAPPH